MAEVPGQPGSGVPPIYLFLDIDGVLHPEGAGPELEFCHLDNMEMVLREFPQVLVVVSSAWRLESSLEELRRRFTPDIQVRIAGVTPSLSALESERGQRQRECEAWLQEFAPGSRWLAIDDREKYFDEGCAQLVLLPHVHFGGTGLEGAYIALLRNRIQLLLAQGARHGA